MRPLRPSLNPAGYMAAIGAVYAAAAMLANAYSGHGVVDPQVVVAGVGAFLALLTRQAVTPVKDPRDGNGAPLLSALAAQTVLPKAPKPPPTGAVTVLPPGVPPSSRLTDPPAPPADAPSGVPPGETHG
jgi:hypothetical protein